MGSFRLEGTQGWFILEWLGSRVQFYSSFKGFTHPQPLQGGEFFREPSGKGVLSKRPGKQIWRRIVFDPFLNCCYHLVQILLNLQIIEAQEVYAEVFQSLLALSVIAFFTGVAFSINFDGEV